MVTKPVLAIFSILVLLGLIPVAFAQDTSEDIIIRLAANEEMLINEYFPFHLHIWHEDTHVQRIFYRSHVESLAQLQEGKEYRLVATSDPQGDGSRLYAEEEVVVSNDLLATGAFTLFLERQEKREMYIATPMGEYLDELVVYRFSGEDGRRARLSNHKVHRDADGVRFSGFTGMHYQLVKSWNAPLSRRYQSPPFQIRKGKGVQKERWQQDPPPVLRFVLNDVNPNHVKGVGLYHVEAKNKLIRFDRRIGIERSSSNPRSWELRSDLPEAGQYLFKIRLADREKLYEIPVVFSNDDLVQGREIVLPIDIESTLTTLTVSVGGYEPKNSFNLRPAFHIELRTPSGELADRRTIPQNRNETQVNFTVSPGDYHLLGHGRWQRTIMQTITVSKGESEVSIKRESVERVAIPKSLDDNLLVSSIVWEPSDSWPMINLEEEALSIADMRLLGGFPAYDDPEQLFIHISDNSEQPAGTGILSLSELLGEDSLAFHEVDLRISNAEEVMKSLLAARVDAAAEKGPLAKQIMNKLNQDTTWTLHIEDARWSDMPALQSFPVRDADDLPVIPRLLTGSYQVRIGHWRSNLFTVPVAAGDQHLILKSVRP